MQKIQKGISDYIKKDDYQRYQLKSKRGKGKTEETNKKELEPEEVNK